MERLKAAHPDGVVFSGCDELFCGAQVMGADGCIGSSVNVVPEYYQRMKSCLAAGDNALAYRMQRTANTFLEVLAEVGFFPAIKHLLCFQGVPVGTCRPPFGPLPAERGKRVEKAYLDCEEEMRSLSEEKQP